MEQSFKIAELIHKFIKGELNENETNELEQWKQSDPNNLLLFEQVKESPRLIKKIDIYQQFGKEEAWKRISESLKTTKVVPLYSKPIWRYAAAILLPMFLAAGVVYYLLNQPTADPLAGIDEVVMPGTQKAILTLADGQEVKLSKLATVPDQVDNTIKVRNNQQTLVYEEVAVPPTQEMVPMNTLQTTLGSNYRLILSDGTRVMLNAGSTLKYPVAFTGNVRQVSLTGEAFFEVSHTGQSFVVTSESHEVQVLGTTFNVHAYPEESSVVTTLVEGSVRIQQGAVSELLEPGEQSDWVKSENLLRISTVDVNDYTAWTRGKFQFSHHNMSEIMRELSRWYDFDYEFENVEKSQLHFTGRIDNSEPISSILGMLKMTTDIQFEWNENKIIIK